MEKSKIWIFDKLLLIARINFDLTVYLESQNYGYNLFNHIKSIMDRIVIKINYQDLYRIFLFPFKSYTQ